jgi:hypothetical protein
MMIFQKRIPRRTFLRGVGATLALPLLDGMIPAFAAPLETARPLRLCFVYVPNGIIMDKWTPKEEGAAFQLTPILQPLAPFRDRMLVLSGLAHNNAEAQAGEGAGDHARAAAVFLTGTHPKKTEGFDFRTGTSIDQVAAKELGKQTQLASLEVGLDPNEIVGACDCGYSCAYSNTLCWRSPTTPMPMENHPRAIFERLFGDSESTDAEERRERFEEDRSVLDYVRQDVARLLNGVGPRDRAKLTEYLDAVRDVERRIQLGEEQSFRELPSLERPVGVPATFTEHAKLMIDLQVLAYQTDLTRVISFMMGREQNTRVYDELGISDSYHPLTHHMHDPAKIAKVIQIDILHTQMLAYFLGKLRSTPDGDGSLLDHLMLVYGSAISDGNMHVHKDLPVLFVGGGVGGIQGGRHIRYPQNTPTANLYLTIMDQLGIAVDQFGDSTGRLAL